MGVGKMKGLMVICCGMLGGECGEDEGTDGDMLWNVGE